MYAARMIDCIEVRLQARANMRTRCVRVIKRRNLPDNQLGCSWRQYQHQSGNGSKCLERTESHRSPQKSVDDAPGNIHIVADVSER